MTATPKAAPDRIYLFVYGSLRRDEPGHELLARSGAMFVAKVAKSHLRWIETGYPTCIESDSASDIVEGEIWDVPAADLPLLNLYEGDNYKLVRLWNTNLHAYLLKDHDADKFVETT